MNNKKDIYDVSKYSDKELYGLLDLNNPSDRELEAKIIFMIKKYNNMQNISGDKLAIFFTDIYNRFFDTQEEDFQDTQEEDIQEEDTQEEDTQDTQENKNRIEGFDNIVPPVQQTPKTPKTTTTISNGLEDTDINNIIKNQNLTNTNIGFIKSLDYAPDKLNPLLNQTIKRIISIDSQYRDDKTTLSTEFNFNLSTPLKDVVSLKLYSVQIPYTWYTINKSYGSNFFYLKGNKPGILNEPYQYMYFDISAGNYSPQELVTEVKKSIVNKGKNIYSDVSFGNTNISYNSNTSLATFYIDIIKQYNENSYYLQFNTFTTPNTTDENRINSITSFLGFNNQTYDLNNLNSSTLPLYNINSNSVDDSTLYFYLTSSNNYITIIKYIGIIDSETNEIDSYNSNSFVDLSFNIKLSLKTDVSYNRIDIVNDLSNQLIKCTYLSSESYIKRINITDDIANINYLKSIYQLKIKPNRFKTNNLTNSKIAIKFPDESTNQYPIWVGENSCFKFNNIINEINNITSETPAIKQTITYPVIGNPNITINCIANNFISPLNNILITIEPSGEDSSYTIDEYINVINRGIINATKNTPFLDGPPPISPSSSISNYSYIYNNILLPEYTYSFIDNNDYFNLFLKINKKFDNTMYRLDFTNSYLYNELNIGNNNYGTTAITTNDTIQITGNINNNNLNIQTGKMPQVDLSNVQVQMSFKEPFINGNTFGTSTYGLIYLSKKDKDYSNTNINNNWIINNDYYMYTVTETIYTVTTKSFNIPDKKIDISLNSINVTNNNFNVPNNTINYVGGVFSIPNYISNIYFDNYNYQISGSNLSMNANSWNIISSSFTVDNNNWNINGNIVITNDTSWNIYNKNFILSNNNNKKNNIDFSGNLLKIYNSDNFDISNNLINEPINIYNNNWVLNVSDISLNNNIFTALTNNIYSNTILNPIIINNTIDIYSLNIINTINFYNLSVNIGEGLNVNINSNSNSNDIIFNVTYITKILSINCNKIIVNNSSIIIIGNFITYDGVIYNYNNYTDLQNQQISSNIFNFSSNNDGNIRTQITFSFTSISNINILGNIKVTSVNKFITSFLTSDYPKDELIYSSKSFCVKNYDTSNSLIISGDIIDVSGINWKGRGNLFDISKNNSWNLISKDLFVYDLSFQFLDSSINLPSSKLSIPNSLLINDNSFNIISNSFYTDSGNVIVNSNNIIDTSSINVFNIYSNNYNPPPNTISISDNSDNTGKIYNITSNSFNINNALLLPNNIITYGNNITINKNIISGYDIISQQQQLTVSADLINVANNGSIIFTGRRYSVNKKAIKIDYTIDFSINVIYNKSYSSLTNLISNFSLLSQYTIPVNQKIVTIYPRFSNTINIPVFGNENDVGYTITNNTGKDIVCNSINELEQNINSFFNSFLDNNNENIFIGSNIILSLNNNSSIISVNSNLNISINKQLKNKDYSISFNNNNNNSWKDHFFIDISNSYGLINSKNFSYITINTVSNTSLIKGYKPIDIFVIDLIDNVNNILTFKAYENGTISNDIEIKVPVTNNGQKIIYSRNALINTLNDLLSQTLGEGSYFSTVSINNLLYTVLRTNINLIYTSENYNIVFYDTVSFVECYVGATSVRNTTWDTTIGWILGFRDNSEYDLSLYSQSNNICQITGDTGVCTNLFNYFLLCIDDFTQNHINDGLITLTSSDKNIPLQSYANRSNFICDPISGQLIYDNLSRTDYSKLTQKQIYAITEVANSKNTNSTNLTKNINSKNFGIGPFVQDIFGIVPMKVSGLQAGSNYIEFGGTLQNQERVYFGPVNITRMSIKLVTDRGDIVDLNNVNWSFSLLCEQLYKQPSKK